MSQDQVNEVYKQPGGYGDAPEQVSKYLFNNPSVAEKATESGQYDDFIGAGLEAALAKRSQSLYGREGAIYGAGSGAAIGAAAAQRGKRIKGKVGRSVARGIGGGLLGAAIGGASGLVSPETGMAMAPAATALVGVGAGTRAIGAARASRARGKRKAAIAAPRQEASAYMSNVRGDPAFKARAAKRLEADMKAGRGQFFNPAQGTPAYRGMKAGQAYRDARNASRSAATDLAATQKMTDYWAGGAAGLAAYGAGKYYQYQSDRFEKAKRGEGDPYLGNVRTTPGLPGYRL